MIKFNLYALVDTETGEKLKVSYSLDNHVSEKPCVTIRADDYGHELSKFISTNYNNETDSMTDYFVKGRVNLFEGDEGYTEARKTAERYVAKQEARYAKYR